MQTIVAPAELEIRETRLPIELTGHFHGPGPAKQDRSTPIVLHVEATINRHAFGVRPRRPFDWVVGRTVRLEAEITLEPRN